MTETEQIKNVESVVKYALEIHADKQGRWDTSIDEITKEAFAALRLKGFHETQERNAKLTANNLQKKIQDRDLAIDNLRGYISYLENRIVELKVALGDYQD
jgi:DNA gyrase/topoisomerase IV subunit A